MEPSSKRDDEAGPSALPERGIARTHPLTQNQVGAPLEERSQEGGDCIRVIAPVCIQKKEDGWKG
jgi:hypothetical protein